MSGRYALFRWPQALSSLPGFPESLPQRWNLAPGAQVLFVHQPEGELHWRLRDVQQTVKASLEENKNEDLSQTIRKGNGSNERRIHAGSLRRQQRQRRR